jgi:hypothetical protein
MSRDREIMIKELSMVKIAIYLIQRAIYSRTGIGP